MFYDVAPDGRFLMMTSSHTRRNRVDEQLAIPVAERWGLNGLDSALNTRPPV
jgi:hypothetical protein